MKSYKIGPMTKTTINRTKTYRGQTMEQKVRRILNNKEPITDSSPPIYTDRKDGILPDMNIRTDKWEYAVEGMNMVSNTYQGERELSIGERTFDTMTDDQKSKFHEKFPHNKHNKKTDAKGESIPGTGEPKA